MAPMVRLRLRTGTMNDTFSPRSSAGLLRSISWWSSAPARPWSCSSVWRTSASDWVWWNTRVKSRPLAFQCSTPERMSSRSAADQIVELADAQLGHDLAHFLGDEEEEVDDVLGLALELLAQHRILRGHAHRAGVQVALAHHDAAFDDQRRGGEAEFVGAQQRADDHVAAGLHLAVGLHADAAAQAIQHQRLLRLGQAQFPGRADVLDGRHRRGARAAVMAGDHDVVGLGLSHASGHRAHAHFRHQLDRDRGLGVDVLQVVDQLGQVLDRVDVVVRRGRDQAHARHRVAQLGDVFRDLVAGQLAASPGLAPWAILIWIWSAEDRYSAVTPKRPEATCLIFERSESPFLSGTSASMRSAPSTEASVSPS